MGEYGLHSFILACDFRVDDVDRMWEWLKKHHDGLSSMGAHHVSCTNRSGNRAEYW